MDSHIADLLYRVLARYLAKLEIQSLKPQLGVQESSALFAVIKRKREASNLEQEACVTNWSLKDTAIYKHLTKRCCMLHCGKCRIRCFWSLMLGRLCLCCIGFDQFVFNLALVRPPTLRKLNTKSQVSL